MRIDEPPHVAARYDSTAFPIGRHGCRECVPVNPNSVKYLHTIARLQALMNQQFTSEYEVLTMAF